MTGDHLVNCDDLNVIRTAFGKRRGMAGYNPIADTNNDGIVSILDFAVVNKNLPPGLKCS